MILADIHNYLRSVEVADLRYFPHTVAEGFSDLAAVLLYDLYSRLKRQRKKLIRGGFQWTFDSMRVFAETHRFASEAGIRKAFLALESEGLIVIEKSGKFNGKKYDKKWWYRLTPDGRAAAMRRRLRYQPDVASLLGLPKAVLLENVRYHLHAPQSPGFVSLDPEELRLPYVPKTLTRHIEELIDLGLIVRTNAVGHNFVLGKEEVDWRSENEPLTAPIQKLLPSLDPGQIGLLVGHSGNGKTSYSTFAAVQSALGGAKVLYISLEEPATNIYHRIYAQEFGVKYSDLHIGNTKAEDDVQARLREESTRMFALKENLRVVGLDGQHSQIHEIDDEIHSLRSTGFEPKLVIIDQLEFIEVETEEVEAANSEIPVKSTAMESNVMGRALAPALLMRTCFGHEAFSVWCLHQVAGATEGDFTMKQIVGGEDVANQFDKVVGLGRSEKDSAEIRVFSLLKSTRFDETLDADFAHMRFRPRQK